MGEIHFDTNIPLVSNISSIVANTNSSHTVLYVLNEDKNMKYPIRQFNSAVKSWLSWFRLSLYPSDLHAKS